MFRHNSDFIICALLILLESSVNGKRVEQNLRRRRSTPLVFGILSQPYYGDGHDEDNSDDTDYNSTYIAASYVKWLEDGGARSIPIPYDASPSLVEDILGQVDGVLFPGGGSSLPSSAITIWEKLHSESYYYPTKDKVPGDMIPLWGTCLGMEFIVQLAADPTEKDCRCRFNEDILEKGYDATNISLPLLEVDRTGLYQPESVYDIVTEYNVTMNNHHLGISPERFRNNSGLTRRFDITSINYDGNGKPFVSTIEPSKRYSTKLSLSSSGLPPVYGVQYHPEKNIHEYGFYPNTAIPYEAIDHSPEAIDFSLYEARFLVSLARENIDSRRYTNGGEVVQSVPGKYNKPDLYPMIYTYPRVVGYKFEERYIIPLANRWETEEQDTNDLSNQSMENRGDSSVDATKSRFRRKSRDPTERVEGADSSSKMT